jgi:hypothetical protein
LFRFFILAPADVAFVDSGRGRGPADQLSLAVALRSLPWLGFVPDEVASAPQAAVLRLAEQLHVDRPRSARTGVGRTPAPSICGWRRSIWDDGRRRR